MAIYQAVGQNIHRIRKAQQLSIDRAAALSGVSKSMLGQIERGESSPTISTLGKIVEGIPVPLEELLYREKDGTLAKPNGWMRTSAEG